MPADFVRARDGGGGSTTMNSSGGGGGGSPDTGDLIEARYRGGAKWFSGKVLRKRPDGSFDIRYDDGDSESGVRSEYVRLKDGGGGGGGGMSSPDRRLGSSVGGGERIREGDVVEAR